MNKVIGTTLAIAMVVTCMPVANVKNVHAAEKKNTAYKLVWSDEFNGTSLNMNNWNYNIGNDALVCNFQGLCSGACRADLLDGAAIIVDIERRI